MATNEKLRRASSILIALGEVFALAASGEHPASVVLEKLDQCEEKCVREIEERELRDPLRTQISFLRQLFFWKRRDIVSSVWGA